MPIWAATVSRKLASSAPSSAAVRTSSAPRSPATASGRAWTQSAAVLRRLVRGLLVSGGSDGEAAAQSGWWRGGEAELLRLGRLEADEGGLDAGMAGKFGGADAQDFLGVQRLGDGAGDAHDDFQFAGAIGDALFQGAVEGLELAGHGFELGGELLDFVAGSGGGGNRAEVAGGDASGGQGQVTQPTGGADGGEADEGGGQQGRAEQGDQDEEAGSAEGFDEGGPGTFHHQAASRTRPTARSR